MRPGNKKEKYLMENDEQETFKCQHMQTAAAKRFVQFVSYFFLILSRNMLQNISQCGETQIH